MALETLIYNDNNQEHRGFADSLGQLQGGIIKGTLTRNSTHAYYAGHEMKNQGESWTQGDYHLKADCTGKGKGSGRSQNRVIVRMAKGDTLTEGWAVAWRHDDRLLKLSDGFFTRAASIRKYITG
jgi:hypothetical protein